MNIRPLPAFACLLAFSASAAAADSPSSDISDARMAERIDALSQFGANPEGGVSRVAFSNADIAGREYITDLMREADVVIEGFANHAGTTPMDRRRDAIVSAAELTLAINDIATSMPGRQVATVGRIRAEPGAPNVIPGRVVMSLEIRDLSAGKIMQVFEEVEAAAARIAEKHDTPIRFEPTGVASEPAPTDERMRRTIAAAAEGLGLAYTVMPSGAGHDAQDMTHIAPTGMIFVRSEGGISHSPKEYTSPEDMANGARVLLETVLAIDGGALE